MCYNIQSWAKVCYILCKGSTYKKYNRLLPATVYVDIGFEIRRRWAWYVQYNEAIIYLRKFELGACMSVSKLRHPVLIMSQT